MTLFKRHLSTILILFTMLFFSTYCYAETIASVTLEGRHYTEMQDISDTEECGFILTACKNAPMPEGSLDGTKKVSIKPGGRFEFGEIYFTRPGIYEYIVSREKAERDNTITDESVYLVSVEVYSDGSTAVLYHKKGEQGKPESIKYEDTVKNRGSDGKLNGTGTSVKTGDTLYSSKYIILFMTALVGLIICRFILKKGDAQASPAQPEQEKIN